MKIVAIIGSPKGRGAGYEIVRRIEEQMSALGDVQFDYLFLKDVNLEPCRGCFLCVTKGEDRCPIRDDRREIEDRIEAADGIILSSPCYVCNMSTPMKNFTDRLCYINHRPRFFRQKLMLVANASSGMEETLKAMRHTLGPGPEVVKELSDRLSPTICAFAFSRKCPTTPQIICRPTMPTTATPTPTITTPA